MTLIIDTNVDCTNEYPSLMALGVTETIRYGDRLAPNNPKVFNPREARAAADAGMRIGLVYEIGGHPSGASQGQIDREWCEAWLPTIGMAQPGVSIFNTVDYDAQAADTPGIVAYFKAFLSTKYRSGGYGSGYALSQLTAANAISLRWLSCSTGFTGTKEATLAGQYDLIQSLSPKLAGVDVDVNRLRVPGFDFGARVPFAATAPVVTAPAVELTPEQHEGFLAKLAELFAADGCRHRNDDHARAGAGLRLRRLCNCRHARGSGLI